MPPVPRLALVAVSVLCAFLSSSPAAAGSFRPIGPFGARIDGFAQSRSHPDRMYCLPYRQGVFRSDDRGDTWTRVDTDLPRESPALQRVAVSATNPDLLLVGRPSTDELLRSTDGGVTWTAVAISAAWGATNDISFARNDPGLVLTALGSGAGTGLYRSTDDGLTWAPANAGLGTPDPRQVVWHPTQAGEALLANADGIYRTVNGGLLWTASTSPSGARSIAWCDADPVRAWATGAPNQIQRSDDGGLTFAATAAATGCTDYCSIERLTASPLDPDVAVVGQLSWYCGGDCFSRVGGFRRTTNGGASWSSASWSSDTGSTEDETLVELEFDTGDPTRAYATMTSGTWFLARQGLIRSTDAGASWTRAVNGIGGLEILAVERDAAGTIFVRRDGGRGTWAAPTVGATWVERNPPGAGWTYVPFSFAASGAAAGRIDELGGASSFDTFDPVYQCSTDGGQTWGGIGPPQNSLFVDPLTVATAHATGARVYAWVDAYGPGPELHRSDSGGMAGFNATYPSFPAAAAVVDPGDDLRLFAVDRDTGEVQLSTDGGATWISRSSGLPSDSAVDLFMDPAVPARLAVVFESAGAYRSDDAGVTWSAVLNDVSGDAIVAADWDPAGDRFFLATEQRGAYVPGTGLVTAGLPTRDLTSVLYDPGSGKVLVGTGHASVWAMDPASPTESAVVAEAPGHLRLDAHPNPFRGEIRFSIAAPGRGVPELTIHDVAGRRVATPVVSEGGRAVWEGRDGRGHRVAAGVYFVRLRAGQEQITRRIVLLER